MFKKTEEACPKILWHGGFKEVKKPNWLDRAEGRENG